MNLLHMKYAVEVARTGSINKVAEELFVAQPNLSRYIKELEADLGIAIFDRTSKGMVLTPQGEIFVHYAKIVLKQVDDIERMCRNSIVPKQHFSVSVPGTSYISDAFARFSRELTDAPAEIFYTEASPSKTIRNILENDYKLGIIRYSVIHEKYFKDLLEEKGLAYEMIAEFSHVVLMSDQNPLSAKEAVTLEDLKPLIEIAHCDPYVSSLPMNVTIKEEQSARVMYLLERGEQFDILSENPDAFMWGAPIPEKYLKRYGLSQKRCTDNQKTYKDVLIRKKEYALTELDNRFITQVVVSKRSCL